jgi:O-antigen/teichoic acid export membrane protein
MLPRYETDVTEPRVGSNKATGLSERAAVPGRSLRGTVAASWHRHQDLLSNAGSLLATTGVTSALGFIYWAFAAREFRQTDVGYSSAAVSAMTLLGTIGMLGLGTLLIGELPRRSGPRAGLVSASLVACGLGSLVLGLAFAVVAPHLSIRFANMVGTPVQAALFTVGVALTGVSLVFDQATIGLMRGGLQLWRNSVLSVIKMLVLAATAVTLHDRFGVGITLSWVVGIALSLVLIAVRLRFAGTRVLRRPDWGVLRGLGRTAMAHNWLNLAIMMPTSLLPVLVTVIVSPSANAAFYIATMITGFVFIVPSHLATVLFAVVAADPKVIARKMRFALRLSYLIGLPGMAVLILGAHVLLSLFGKSYAADATLPMWLMTLGYPAAVPKALYIAVCRANGKISRAAVVLTVCSTAELAVAAAGGVKGGLVGLSVALLAVKYAEALVTGPPVLRAAFGHGRHRRPESTAAGFYTGSPASPAQTEASKRIQQEAGIAALLALATSTNGTGPLPVIPVGLGDPRTPRRYLNDDLYRHYQQR